MDGDQPLEPTESQALAAEAVRGGEPIATSRGAWIARRRALAPRMVIER